MATGGYGQGGASASGPSSVSLALPYAGWKDQYAGGSGSGWLEEFTDALGIPIDVLNAIFGTATARANLLDPTYTPPYSAGTNQATLTQPPSGASVTDTMLDVLCFIVGIPFPLDSSLTVAQKQALAQVGQAAMRRKGTRTQILALAAALTDGIVYGWSTPPFGFSVIVPDGAPEPGWKLATASGWVPAFGASAIVRPWLFEAIRRLTSHVFPAWSQFGVGYSQYRAGYSAAGEPVFPIDCTINLLANEHFSAWTASVPDSWTASGTTSALSENAGTANSASTNWEFTGSCALIDLSSALSGVETAIDQSTVAINNQVTHRLQIDYSYTNTEAVARLELVITDANRDGNVYYWDPGLATWSTTASSIVLPVGASATDRVRYACDIVPQLASSTGTIMGTQALNVRVRATSDGTATTKLKYLIYRVGLYEKFDAAIEAAAGGDRTLWLPLHDSLGFATAV